LSPDGPDTICAIATATGGGVGIVRISGPHAEAIVASVVRPWPRARPQSHKMILGWAHDPRTGERIDQVLACVMRAPRSYTGEDVAELHGHGGARVLERLLDAAMAQGARAAQPGEFTRRAFENGRLDLTRAEAVAELIAARSDRALAAARALAGGALEKEVIAIRGALVRALAELEGAIDFPDEQLDAPAAPESARTLGELAARCATLAGSYRRIDRERVEIALAGRVNAGKSSLLNALAGRERALVDSEPGTTRDVVEVDLDLDGIAVRLLDTAGERLDGHAPASVEQRGLQLGRDRRAAADVCVLVIDGMLGFTDGDHALYEALAPAPRVIAWNKRDRSGPAANLPDGAVAVETSATESTGLDGLRAALRRALGDEGEAPELRVNLRHRAALLDAARTLEAACLLLAGDEPPELASGEARSALHHLGLITGETVDAELLDAIFARFCLGK
jgi:tRNA modification GTPase